MKRNAEVAICGTWLGEPMDVGDQRCWNRHTTDNATRTTRVSTTRVPCNHRVHEHDPNNGARGHTRHTTITPTHQRGSHNRCLKAYGLWKNTNTGHTKILSKEMTKCPQLEWICDKTRKRHVLNRSYKVTVEGNITYKTNTAAIDVYTDGSETNSGTGAGVYCPELNINIAQALGRNNSVF
ncbi:jg11894 [Pararge aegeria aegeria]|uniref:Jg11894 protein n=1 Tax=Pararge aegeria aegeria TaxID=348720 RepID=A0A8S4RYQ7_9NEOP|nr:jg11894 [Pararge aegeria aegeria]